MYRIALWIAALGCVAAGCGPAAQPYVTPERMNRGLVVVLTGIEGRSSVNDQMVKGLAEGGVEYAIELNDWTIRIPLPAYLLTLRAERRNRQKASEIADGIVRYQMKYPGRPVILMGQSGGGAMACWVAESMPPGRAVDGIIMLAAALSPEYLLDMALMNSRRGIVSFYSSRDWLLLGAGTLLMGTMDGEHTSSAGKNGFTIPPESQRPKLYNKLFQVAWQKEMGQSGNSGSHLSSGAHAFVARYVAPLVRTPRWQESTIEELLAGTLEAKTSAAAHASAVPVTVPPPPPPPARPKPPRSFD